MRDVVFRRGVVDATGARHRRATVRPLTGREEGWLTGGPLGAGDASALLAACTTRLGGYHDVTAGLVALLTRGDRARLALALRRLMCGDQLVLTLTCPNGSCGEQADLELRVTDLLVDGADPVQPEPEEVSVATPDGTARVRAPLGVDDEAVEAAPLPAGLCPGAERDARSALLWSRLVLDLDGAGPPSPAGWLTLGGETRQHLARAVVELDSTLDLFIVTACPACGTALEVELDPFDLLARELGLGSSRLLAEVHSLAFHYGWSEDAVLDLPRTRRWAYLELLRNQLEGRPLVDAWS